MSYFKVPSSVFKLGLSPSEIVVLIYLYSVKNMGVKAHYVVASLESISKGSGYRSVDSAISALRSLGHRGIVSPFKRFRPDGTRAANGYTIHLPIPSKGYFKVEREQYGKALSCTGKTGAAIYLFMTSIKNRAGGAFPSLTKTAAAVGSTVCTVIKKIRELCRMRAMAKLQRKKIDRSFGHNLYRVFSFVLPGEKRAKEKHALRERANPISKLMLMFELYNNAAANFCQAVLGKVHDFFRRGTIIFREQLYNPLRLRTAKKE